MRAADPIDDDGSREKMTRAARARAHSLAGAGSV
jgi:hypothetical protein